MMGEGCHFLWEMGLVLVVVWVSHGSGRGLQWIRWFGSKLEVGDGCRKKFIWREYVMKDYIVINTG